MFKDGRIYKEICIEKEIEIWLQNEKKKKFIGMMNNVIMNNNNECGLDGIYQSLH